ncbi:hypothetical protein HG530_008080 [Fusarium avenaceum]|nr:hypothetical protein HG530_008080 [Fusarium avenaceum]
MSKRLGHISRVEEETQQHGRADSDEQKDIDDVYSHADLPEPRELMWLGKDEERQAASAHRECVPGPCEVVQPLLEGHLGAVRIEHVDSTVAFVVVVIVLVLEWFLSLLDSRRNGFAVGVCVMVGHLERVDFDIELT